MPREEEKEKGGYECEFVESPPKQLQSECSICLLVLREPYIVSCCGHSFCETCIGCIQRDGKPCPLCNEPGFTTMANKGLKRTLNEFQVRCPHRELGCEWVGELGKLDQHLNADPQPERQLEGCPFTSVECIHCKDHMKRHMAAGHQNELCPKRPYTCEYCEEYEALFRDVVDHWAECKCYLLPCPNNCHLSGSGSGIKRQDMEHHVKEECPLIVVECDFHYVGCDMKLPRKDMAGHMKEESVAHTSLLLAVNQRLAKQLLERDEKMQQLTQQNTKLSDKINQLEIAHQELVCTTDKTCQKLKSEVTEAKDKLQQQQEVQQELAEKTNQQQKTNQELRKGLTQTKDKQRQQQRAHRELAEKVAWTTDHQQKTNQELRKGLTQTKDTLLRQQVVHQELAEKVSHTASQEVMEKVARQVKDLAQTMQQQQAADHELTSEVASGQEQMGRLQPREVLSSPQRPPIVIKMAGFKALKDMNATWYSSPFYSHICGYKMCLNVDANGDGAGKGTHVSVFMCLMCGEFDSDLKWPFRGDITIQLLNQLEYGEHLAVTIPYTDSTVDDDVAGRVTTGEKAVGFGQEQFIAHTQLNFSHAKKCQYLKDDCLLFTILSVNMQECV